MKKKGQGINAAVLVAIIAALIIIYFIFLPESEIGGILENKTAKEKGKNDDKKGILLQEFPGRLDFFKNAEDKEIPNIYLFESTNSKELEKINPFQVRNGVWDKKIHTVDFSIDPDTTADVLLSFKIKKSKGILAIKLNDNVIYENEETGDVEPVGLKQSYLKKDNVLEFSVSSVGWRFWATNEYSIENAKITGDITDLSRQKSQNVFSLAQSEYRNLDKATLKFVPYCGNAARVGNLEIAINNHNVFSAVPVCDDPYSQNVPTGLLDAGENNIVFKTEKGSYSVEQIKLVLESKESRSNKYFFEVNETVFKDIEKKSSDLILTIEFAKGLEDEVKRGELNLNGRFLTLDLDEDEQNYTKNINDYALKGNNYIEIKPKTILDIKEIRVKLED